MKLTFALVFVVLAFLAPGTFFYNNFNNYSNIFTLYYFLAFAVDPDLLTPELSLPGRPCLPVMSKPFPNGGQEIVRKEFIGERVSYDGGDYDQRYYNRRDGPRRGLSFGNGQFGGNRFGDKRALDF